MADKDTENPGVVYARDAMGQPVYVRGPNAAQQVSDLGYQPIGQQEAEAGTAARRDLSYVDKNWGALGQGAYGLFKGLTLGLGPGMAVQGGLIDPGHAMAADISPYAQAGDIAGTIAPALLSGGESLLARTPAGMLPYAGSAAERIAGGFLGYTAPGLLGSAAMPAIKMAARGAAEGALLNVGHQIGDNLVQNKPFAAEALAAMGDGALFGALIGGGLGTAGLVGQAAVDSVGSMARRVAQGGGEEAALSRVARELNTDITNMPKDVSKATLRSMGEGLEEFGSGVGDTPTGKWEASKKLVAAKTSIREGAVKALDDAAPLETPGYAPIESQVQNIAERYRTTPMRQAVDREVGTIQKELQNLWPMQEVPEVNVPGKPAVMSSKFKGLVEEPAVEGYKINGFSVPSDAKPTWKELIKFRDEFAQKADTEIRKEVLSIIDSQIGTSMTDAGLKYGDAAANAAKEYAASTASLELGKQMERNLGQLANRSTGGGFGSNIQDRDIGTAGGMAIGLGRPSSAVSWLAAKSVGKVLSERVRPWLAQMAYDSSVANKAATATVNVKSRIGKSLDNFFKTTAKAPEKAAQAAKADQKRGPAIDRTKYEVEASRVQQLLSDNHAARVQDMAYKLEQEGHQALANAMLDMNQRAVLYITNAMPKRQGVKSMQSLRAIPVPKTLTMDEHKFMRTLSGLDPLKVLDHFEDGSLSREEVRTMAYVYPEFKQEFVSQAMNKVVDMKAKGQSLPLEKINSLGIMLDTAIDRIQEKDYVGSVQMALNAPPANAPPGPAPHSPANMTVQSTGLMTPLQQNLMG